MKKILMIPVTIFLTVSLLAQAPQKMSYQAVVRDASNNLVINSNIGVQVSILQGSSTGTGVYSERHFPVTNENGLVTLEVGTGVVVNGDFSAIDWANDTYFIEISVNSTVMGTSQLLSVPMQ